MIQQWTLEQSTAPTEEPITPAEAKRYGWVTSDDDDGLIADLIATVRQRFEALTGLQLVTATYKQYLDCFPGEILFLRNPVIAITSIAYVDTAGTTQTLASSEYQLDSKSRPARLMPAYAATWPAIRAQYNAVTITYTAGFGAASAVPKEYKHRIWQAAKYRYDHRDETNENWLDQFLASNWQGWIY